MLRLRGNPALSPFRLEKLLAVIQRRVPAVTGVYAEFVHFIDTETLASQEREVLERLLSYGPAIPAHQLRGEPALLVVPRPGTLSPWSSKATDIAHNCGLEQVRRIEFGSPRSLGLKSAWALAHRMDKSLFPQAVVIPLMDDHRILTQVAGHHIDVIQLLPPLVIDEADVRWFLDAFEQVMVKLHKFPGPAVAGP